MAPAGQTVYLFSHSTPHQALKAQRNNVTAGEIRVTAQPENIIVIIIALTAKPKI